MPFRIVLDKIQETPKVIRMPRQISRASSSAPDREEAAVEPAKKIVIRASSVGKRPLQGIKLLVKMAISRSLGESMILHPVTPTALQPRPIHMVYMNL